MIVEFPQAETCCGALSLRFGIVITIVIRLILFVLLILFFTNAFPVGEHHKDNEHRWNTTTGSWKCYDLENVATADLVLLVVTVTLVVLWILIMIPAVVLESPAAVLIGCVLEIIIWFWFVFITAYNITISIIRENVTFMFIYSFVWMVMECYVLWLVWSYYVDLKADIQRLRREEGRSRSTDTDSPTSTY